MPFLHGLIVYHRKQFQMMRGLLEIFIFHQCGCKWCEPWERFALTPFIFIFHQQRLILCKWCEPRERFASNLFIYKYYLFSITGNAFAGNAVNLWKDLHALYCLCSAIYQRLEQFMKHYPDLSYITKIYKKCSNLSEINNSCENEICIDKNSILRPKI